MTRATERIPRNEDMNKKDDEISISTSQQEQLNSRNVLYQQFAMGNIVRRLPQKRGE